MILEIPDNLKFQVVPADALHADFSRIKLLQVTDLVPDQRIEALLKKGPYSASAGA